MRTILLTPPVARIVPDGVFDAFGWCPSDTLEWGEPASRSMATLAEEPLTLENPPRMIFVMKRELAFLPRELARLHAPRSGLTDEWALAPYGIDDATDELWAKRVRPGDAFWLATDSLRGLFWGLHDWAHFHNHGPFTMRAWTELQCDAAALAWLWLNREQIALTPDDWEELRLAAIRNAALRFDDEGATFDARLLAGPRAQELAVREGG